MVHLGTSWDFRAGESGRMPVFPHFMFFFSDHKTGGKQTIGVYFVLRLLSAGPESVARPRTRPRSILSRSRSTAAEGASAALEGGHCQHSSGRLVAVRPQELLLQGHGGGGRRSGHPRQGQRPVAVAGQKSSQGQAGSWQGEDGGGARILPGLRSREGSFLQHYIYGSLNTHFFVPVLI